MGRPEEPIAHGTYSGYQAHKKRAEKACGPCKRANADYNRKYRRSRKCAPGLGWPLEASR